MEALTDPVPPICCTFCQKKANYSSNGPKVKLFLCGRCKLAHYCGVDCQSAHWDQHKQFCIRVGSEIYYQTPEIPNLPVDPTLPTNPLNLRFRPAPPTDDKIADLCAREQAARAKYATKQRKDETFQDKVKYVAPSIQDSDPMLKTALAWREAGVNTEARTKLLADKTPGELLELLRCSVYEQLATNDVLKALSMMSQSSQLQFMALLERASEIVGPPPGQMSADRVISTPPIPVPAAEGIDTWPNQMPAADEAVGTPPDEMPADEAIHASPKQRQDTALRKLVEEIARKLPNETQVTALRTLVDAIVAAPLSETQTGALRTLVAELVDKVADKAQATALRQRVDEAYADLCVYRDDELGQAAVRALVPEVRAARARWMACHRATDYLYGVRQCEQAKAEWLLASLLAHHPYEPTRNRNPAAYLTEDRAPDAAIAKKIIRVLIALGARDIDEGHFWEMDDRYDGLRLNANQDALGMRLGANPWDTGLLARILKVNADVKED